MRENFYVKFPTLRQFASVILVYLMVFGSVQAQCPLSSDLQGGTIVPDACGWQSTSDIGSGTYINVNVHNGGIYDFSHCNALNWGNSQLGGYVVGSGVLFYNDDNGPFCNGTRASVTWNSNITGQIAVGSNISPCQGWVGGGAGNSGVLDYRCTGPGNPAVYGNGEWILYGWNAGDANGGSGAWTNCYSGFMTVAPLSFNTTSLWNATGSPSDAGSFLGCAIAPNNHSWSAKRTGFACDVYQVVVDYHDDLAQVIINGNTTVLPGTGGPTTIYTGVLNNASTVEFRVSEGTASSQAQITITPVTVGGLTAGAITGNQTICPLADPSILNNSVLPTGGAGPNYTNGGYTYDWTYQDDCQGGTISLGVNADSYDPPPGVGNTRCYYRTVSDACGNTVSTSAVTVTVSSPAVITYNLTDALCSGDSSGTIDISATGGTGAFDYSIDGGANFVSNSLFQNLPSGSYNLAVRDAIGCVTVYSGNPVVIGQPTDITQTLTKTDASCGNVFDGTITVSALGGTPPYTYSLNGGPTQPSNTITGVGAGSYIVYVFDNNGCFDTAGITIGNNYTVTMTLLSQTNISCFGAGDGAATVQMTNGTPPYSYSLNGSPFRPDSTFTGLVAGTYYITGRDAKGCTELVTVTISQPGAVTVVVDSILSIPCGGDSTGAIYITINGGNGVNTFTWSNGATTEDNVNIPAGVYSVTVSDSNGCSAIGGAVVNEPTLLVLNVAIYNDLLCNNDSSGAIDITANGGTPGYTYLWSTNDTTEDRANLYAGTYSATVTDANGCQRSITQTLTEPLILSSTIAGTNVACNGTNTGSADITVTGGTTPYFYEWSNFQNIEDATGLGAGLHFVTVTDVNGCRTRDSIVLTEPTPIVISKVVTNITCFNANDGIIDLTVSGGTPGYTYIWNTTDTTEDIDTLAPGTYVVTVTDAAGCQKVDSVSFINPSPFYVSGVVKHITCFGYNDGAIDITAYGGVLPYSFAWSTGQSTEDLWNLPGGRDTVVVTDFNGCKAASIYVINEPQPLVANIIATNGTCNGVNASVAVVPSGGTTPYTYLWNTFDTDSFILVGASGRYVVQVTDSNGCFTYDSAYVTQPVPLFTNISVSNPTCAGGNNGFIQVTASGGAIPYSYAWNTTPPQTGAVATGLSQGTYILTLSDANNCSSTVSVPVNDPLPITITVTPTGSRCFNTATGTVVATATGGTPPYVYEVNGVVQPSGSFFGLLPGNYVFEVRDANGCEGNLPFTITSPSEVIVDLQAPMNVILQGMSTQLIADVTSSQSPVINYAWSPLTDTAGNSIFDFSNCSDPNNCFNPLAAPQFTTTFTVMVMNADSCLGYDTVTVYVETSFSRFIPTAFTPNGDNLNDRFEFDILGATTAEVAVFNRWGEQIYVNPAQPNGLTNNNGWDGTKDGELLPADTYVYQLKVTYYDNTVQDISGTVNIMR